MAGSRNFATKVWNAARFTLCPARGQARGRRSLEGGRLTLPDRWILSRLRGDRRRRQPAPRGLPLRRGRRRDLRAYVWHELCDGYLEMVKPVLAGSDTDGRSETARGVLRRCLEGSLALLHPFMPFVTEEIWEKLTGRPGTLIVSPYPAGRRRPGRRGRGGGRGAARGRDARAQLPRAERGASPTEPVTLTIDPASPSRALAAALQELAPLLIHLARLDRLTLRARLRRERFRTWCRVSPLGLSLPRSGLGARRGARVEKTRGGRGRRDRVSAREAPESGVPARRPRPRSSRRRGRACSSSRRSGRRSARS